MKRIRMQTCGWLLLPVLLLAMPAAYADDHDDEMLAGEPDGTEKTLELPDEAAYEGHENAAYGLKEADEARDARRAYGEGRAGSAGGNRSSGGRN